MKKIITLTMLICLAFSCKKEETSINPEIKGINPPAEETEDVVFRYTNAKVYLPADIANQSLGTAILSRCKNTTNDIWDADIVFVSDNLVATLNDNSMLELAKALHTGKVCAYFEPSSNTFRQFASGLSAASNYLLTDETFKTSVNCSNFRQLEQIMEPSLKARATGPFARLVSFRDDGVLVIGRDEDLAVSGTLTYTNPDTKETITENVELSSNLPQATPKACGSMVEKFIEWVENRRIALSDTPEKPITPDRREYRYINHLPYDSSIAVDCKIVRDVPFEILYEIWPVCDRSYNSIKDVYAVKRTFKVEGNKLETGPAEKDYWWVNSKGDAKYYGPYLYFIQADTYFNNVSSMRELKPLNTMTSTSYSENTSIGVSLGVSLGSSPSLSPGVSYTTNYSTSTTLPDLRTTVTPKSNRTLPLYDHTATKRPDSHFGIPITHDIVPNNYHEYIELATSWVWDINNPKDEAPAFTDAVRFSIEMMDYSVGFFKTTPGYYDLNYQIYVNFCFPALPHYNQIWGVELNNEGMTQAEKLVLLYTVQDRYRKYISVEMFNVPAYSMSDRTAILKFKNDFIDVLQHDKQYWKNLSFFGNNEFTWRNNNQQSEFYKFNFIVEK